MEKTYDMKPLDAEQMKAARELLTMAQKFSDDVKQIMIHSHLWHKGFTLKLHVCPTMDIYTEDIQMYRTVEDGDGLYEEEIERVKGKGEEYGNWETNPVCTSREFIHLFDGLPDEVGAGTEGKDTDNVPSCDSTVSSGISSGSVDGGNEIDSGNGYTYTTNN